MEKRLNLFKSNEYPHLSVLLPRLKGRCLFYILIFTLLFSLVPCFTGCADPLTDPVIKGDLVALGTITDNRSEAMTEMVGSSAVKHVYTLYTFSVEKVMKGDPLTKEVFIQVRGGYLDDGRYVSDTGERYFRVADHTLVSLFHKNSNIYVLYYPQNRNEPFQKVVYRHGVLWIKGSATSNEPLDEIISRICRISKNNNLLHAGNTACP